MVPRRIESAQVPRTLIILRNFGYILESEIHLCVKSSIAKLCEMAIFPQRRQLPVTKGGQPKATPPTLYNTLQQIPTLAYIVR